MFSARFIQKAKPRKPWSRTRTYQRLDALSRNMGAAVGADLGRGLRKFKSLVQPQRVYDAWLTGNYEKVVDSIPWAELPEHLDRGLAKVGTTMGEAWGATLLQLPEPSRPELRWDTENPRVREHIAGRSRRNFVQLSEDSVRNIRAWTTASFDRALTPRQVADGIRDSIGLIPQHAVAVERYRQGLAAGGLLSPDRVQQLADEYADRLLDWRAMNIGRTETRLATNQGQLAVWQQAADHGLVDRATAGKSWIVDGNPCEVCDPMDGVTVALDEPWLLPNGDSVMVPTESHPQCMCGMEMVFDREEGE